MVELKSRVIRACVNGAPSSQKPVVKLSVMEDTLG